jgi:autotransporter-associated beta strand protein
VYKITILSLASNLNWNLTDAGTWDTTTTANWYNSKNSTTQAFADGDNVTFDKSAGGIITINGTVTPGTTTVNSSGDYTFESGAIAGDGGITKSGNRKLTLSAANTFTGEVVVNAGTLVVGNANALGAITTGTKILSGATLEISNDITLAAEPLTLVGTGVAGVGALTSQPGVHAVSGPITLGGDTLITSQGSAGPDTFTITGTISGSNSTLTIGGSASTAISGNISGTGLALNKTDNGILTLSNVANNYTGLTTVSAGTLVANNAASISSSVSVASGATLSLQDNHTLTNLTGSGEVLVANGKTFTLNNGSSAQSFGGTFNATSGTAFTKSGSGTLTLSGASTNLSRDVTISEGAVKASNNNALGIGTVLIGTGGSSSTGTLYVAKDKTISNNITVGSSVRGTNELLAGWDFTTTATGGTAAAAAPNSPNKFVANFGTGTLYLDGTNGSSSWITATTGNEVSSFGGNAGSGVFAGSATTSLALIGGASPFTANGKYMVFTVDMSKKSGLTISYDTRGTTSGFTSQIWEYSTDGTSWSPAGTITGLTTSFASKLLSEITALNGDSTAYVRFSGTGATGATGNNRLDNIAFTALGPDSTTGSGTLGIDEAGTATFTGNVVVNNTAELTAASDGTAVFTGEISGLGSLTKTGNGTVELVGANTFTGSLTLSAGNLKVSTLGAGGAASPLGAAADVPGSIIFTGGKLEYAGSADTTLTRDFTVGNGGAGFIASGLGALVIEQEAQMDFDNAAASDRTLTLGGTTDIAVENIFNPAKFDPTEINNLFTKLVKQDVNKWVVLGAGADFVDNAATEVNINGGELDFEMGALGSKSTINVGTATLGWYNSSNADDLSGRINLNAEAASAFNIPPNNTLYFAKSFNGGTATSASLIKLGTGTLELGAANNFSGGLTVSAGTVKASFAGSVGSGAVSISNNATFVVNAVLSNRINVTSGGTLAGTGTDEDATIEEDGILSPNADSIGTLSFNKLTLNGGAHVKWQLQNAAGAAGVGYDTLVIETLNLSNAISTKKKIVVEVTSAGLASGFDKTKVNKFEFASITTDLASGVNVTDLFSIDASQFEIDNNLTNDHLVWSMQYAADRDMMYVTTMIPEPSTYGLGLSALALAAVAIRRRKKKKV